MPHHLEQLSLESLHELKGGLVAAMLNKALSRIAADIETAPDIKDWRKVELVIKAQPVLDQGYLDGVNVEFIVKGTNPARVTSSQMHVKADEVGQRGLYFNVDSPDSPDQMTLYPKDESQQN